MSKFFIILSYIFLTFSLVNGNFNVIRLITTPTDDNDTITVNLRIMHNSQNDTIYGGADIVLTIDASNSMNRPGEDYVTPAKNSAIEFVRGFDELSTRFAAFSFLRNFTFQCDYTYDTTEVIETLRSIELFENYNRSNALPTAITNSIEYALENSIYPNPVVIMFTDIAWNLNATNPPSSHMNQARDAIDDFYNNHNGRLFFVGLDGTGELGSVNELNDVSADELFSTHEIHTIADFIDFIASGILEGNFVQRVDNNNNPVPLITEVISDNFTYVEGSMREGRANTANNPLDNFSITYPDIQGVGAILEFFLDSLSYNDVFHVTYKLVINNRDSDLSNVIVTKEHNEDVFSRIDGTSPGGNVVIPLTGISIESDQDGEDVVVDPDTQEPIVVYGYEVNVYKALFNGFETNRGDTVSFREAFSIEVLMVDENGNLISGYSGMRYLSFNFGTSGNTTPESGFYFFENGRAVIHENRYPFVINSEDYRTINVFDEFDVYGEKDFSVLFQSSLSVVGMPKIYDSNGNGFQDLIVVEFSMELDIAHIVEYKDAIIRGFALQSDYYKKDIISHFFVIEDLVIIDNFSIALILSLSNDTLGQSIIPQTDIEPFLFFETPIPDAGFFAVEEDNYLSNFLVETVEKVGMVVNRAYLENTQDGLTATNSLKLSLSEPLNYQLLELNNPYNGVLILRYNQGVFDTLRLPENATWNNPVVYEGNEVIIREIGDLVFDDSYIYYVKLLPNGGFEDLLENDVHIDNPPRLLKIALAYSHVYLVPNPVYKPGSNDDGLGYGVGAVFRIRTNVPVSISILFTNAQANVINNFRMDVTKDMLERYGQTRDEMKTIYFGSIMQNGYLRTIDPNYIGDDAFNVSHIPESQKWMPINQNGRFVESGAHILRYEVRSSETTSKELWQKYISVIIVK